MPRYKLTDPQTGVVFHLSGDSPPTEAEATEAFQGAALEKSLKGRGFTQEPPPEEFLSKFRNIGSLLKGAAQTPGGAAMLSTIPGTGALASGTARLGSRGIAAAARAAEYLPIPSALAPKTRTLKLLQALGQGATRAAASTPPLMKTAAPALDLKRLIMLPEEAAAAAQKAKLAQMEAQQQGMRYAAYGRRGMP